MRAIVPTLLVALAVCGCASKPIQNRVVPPVDPQALTAIADAPLAVRATPVWDEDWLLENFGANLVVAHVLAVRVAIENRTDAPIDCRRFRLGVTDDQGRAFAQLKPKAARKLIEKTYPLGIRSVEGDRAYRADFAANTLDLETPLPQGASRQGFVFFAMPAEVRGLEPLEMRLAANRR